jgi:hypothetical protein
LQSYPKEELKGHPVSFVNALEEYKARNRKLFGIREIDRLLSFSGKKNICIVDKSYSKSSFLYSIIAQFCIDYCRDTDRSEEEEEEDNKKENKTVLIDAGNGNNLGYIYISLVNKAFKAEADVRKILDKTIVTRAFTFQQLASIVLKEIPTLIQKMDCNIQFIIMDLLGTLVPSSPVMFSSNQNRPNPTGGFLRSNTDFESTMHLLDEMIDQLIEFSGRYLVMVHYNAHRNLNLSESLIPSRFSNSIEIIKNGKMRVMQKARPST